MPTFTASSGTIFHQLQRGAPYDLVIFAGTDFSDLAQSQFQPSQRACLGEAAMALWAPNLSLSPEALRRLLKRPSTTLAVPDARTAPAGKAALELLRLWDAERHPGILTGGSAAHTAHLAIRSATDLALVPLPQIRALQRHQKGQGQGANGTLLLAPKHCCHLSYHAILLKDSPAARHLFAALSGERARQILRNEGYKTPKQCFEQGLERG